MALIVPPFGIDRIKARTAKCTNAMKAVDLARPHPSMSDWDYRVYLMNEWMWKQ